MTAGKGSQTVRKGCIVASFSLSFSIYFSLQASLKLCLPTRLAMLLASQICCLWSPYKLENAINSRPRTQMVSEYATLEASLVDNQPHFQMPRTWCYMSAMPWVCDLTTLLLHTCCPVESDAVAVALERSRGQPEKKPIITMPRTRPGRVEGFQQKKATGQGWRAMAMLTLSAAPGRLSEQRADKVCCPCQK